LIKNADPTQRFLTIGECPHLNNFAIADGVDVGQVHAAPLVAAIKSKLNVNEYYNAISRSDKPLGLAATFGQGARDCAR
jgi:hypothetical protein